MVRVLQPWRYPDSQLDRMHRGLRIHSLQICQVPTSEVHSGEPLQINYVQTKYLYFEALQQDVRLMPQIEARLVQVRF